MTIADAPEARAKDPRSPSLASTFEMMVPSGMQLTGKMLPTVSAAIIIIKVDKPTFASSVDEHSCVHAFNSDEILSTVLVSVLVSENNFGKWSATSGVVDDVLNNSFDVSVKQTSVRITRHR